MSNKHNPEYIFTLIYAERPTDSDALICLTGPSIHKNMDDAMDRLWCYVKGSITGSSLKEEFSEYASTMGVDLHGFDLNEDRDITDEEFNAIIDSIRSDQLRLVCDWYFKRVNDDACCEAFYQIDQHTFNLASDVVAIDAEINDDNVLVIDGVEIDQSIINEELVDYRLVDLEEFIDKLFTRIGEAKDSDRRMMTYDMNELQAWNDDFVWSSITTNEYISPSVHPERFNDICNDVLDHQKAFESANHYQLTISNGNIQA
jgi:hypothetical protein